MGLHFLFSWRLPPLAGIYYYYCAGLSNCCFWSYSGAVTKISSCYVWRVWSKILLILKCSAIYLFLINTYTFYPFLVRTVCVTMWLFFFVCLSQVALFIKIRFPMPHSSFYIIPTISVNKLIFYVFFLKIS